jgi:hypothetical protein
MCAWVVLHGDARRTTAGAARFEREARGRVVGVRVVDESLGADAGQALEAGERVAERAPGVPAVEVADVRPR